MTQLTTQTSIDDLTDEYMIFVERLLNMGAWNDDTHAAASRFKDAAFRHGKQMRALGYLEAKAEQLNNSQTNIEG